MTKDRIRELVRAGDMHPRMAAAIVDLVTEMLAEQSIYREPIANENPMH